MFRQLSDQVYIHSQWHAWQVARWLKLVNWENFSQREKAEIQDRAFHIAFSNAIHEGKNLQPHLQGVAFRLRILSEFASHGYIFFVSFSSQPKNLSDRQDAFRSSSTVLIGERTGWASNSIRALVEFALTRLENLNGPPQARIKIDSTVSSTVRGHALVRSRQSQFVAIS